MNQSFSYRHIFYKAIEIRMTNLKYTTMSITNLALLTYTQFEYIYTRNKDTNRILCFD